MDAKIWGLPKIRGYLFRGPINRDNSIIGSILGSPNFGKLPYSRTPPGPKRRQVMYLDPKPYGFEALLA